MKRNYLLLICILLSLFIFISCKKSASVKDGLSIDFEQENEITFNEEPIPFPTSFSPAELPYNINVLPGEVPTIYTYELEDQKTGAIRFKNYQWIADNWEEVELNWTEAIAKAKINGLAWPIKGNDDFDYFLKFSQPSTNNNRRKKNVKREDVTMEDLTYHIYRLDKNGSIKEVTDSSLFKNDDESDIPRFDELLVLEDSTILVKYNSGKLFRFDLESKEKLNEYENIIPDFTVQGTNLLCMNDKKDKLLIIDIPTGDLLREIKLDIPEIQTSTKFYLDEEDSIYIATMSGIYRMDSEEPILLFSTEKATIFGLNDKKDILIEGISKVDDAIFVYYSVHTDNQNNQNIKDIRDNNKIYQYTPN